MYIIRKIFLLSMLSLLISCNGFFEKDNAPTPKPLRPFKQELNPQMLWRTQAGNGSQGEYLKTSLGLNDKAVFVTSTKGLLTALDKQTGMRLWQVNTNLQITTGPGIDCDKVIIGTRHGEVAAFSILNGARIWIVQIPGEVLATPVIQDQTAIVKTTNGNIYALNKENGGEEWFYQQNEPNFILHSASQPIVTSHAIGVGFANGMLSKLRLKNGQLLWSQVIAVPIGAFATERMVDITADPILCGQRVFAATYQGKITALNWENGDIYWSRDISTYTGMTLDNSYVYVSDAKSALWAFNADTGDNYWLQTQLEARNITGPALIGNYLVVGDNEGFVYFVNKNDGHLSALTRTNSPIFAAPIVENNRIYILSADGHITVYQLNC